MNIPSQVFPGKPLFHSLDKQWRSENVVTFCFLPENEADARTMIAGLIPYIRDTHDPWYLSAFSTEANLRHQSSRWDHKTRQVFSAEEAEISDFLTEDDELNHTDMPTEEKPQLSQIQMLKLMSLLALRTPVTIFTKMLTRCPPFIQVECQSRQLTLVPLQFSSLEYLWTLHH
jgi:hypothetical protein